MRLIDADAFEVVAYKGIPEGYNDTFGDGVVWTLKKIDAQPTVESERKKGEWVKEYWNGEHARKCSACNITQTVTTFRGKVKFNYCPYCGADMRGDAE